MESPFKKTTEQKWWRPLVRKLLSILGGYLILVVFKDNLDPEILELVISLTELLS